MLFRSVVSFTAADGYAVGASGKTLGELISGNYMLAYEKGTSSTDLAGIYGTAKTDPSIVGYYTLYGDGVSPGKMINKISITSSAIDYSTSPYKHINNGGITGSEGPYEIDAITGATLTIEGPGVTSSIPLSIMELENQNAGAFRSSYSDKRNGTDWTLQYEGIRLSHIIKNMTSVMTTKADKVILKNRVRQTIAEFTIDQINAAELAGKPIIVAYGSGTMDSTTVAPFVFDGAAGYKVALDNDDGPIKLVYNKSAFATDPNPSYTEFGNVAYIYVAESTSPGYKHNVSPYNTAENSQYVLTVTGDKIGREVNYTVAQLEAMVEYDTDGKPVASGMGYRDEYSMANSSYWYVNGYEGVQLWKLLQKSGLASSTSNDENKNTLVSFSATDNYKDFDKFTIEQVSNPDLFGYYEKNPADPNDGTYTGVATDLKDTGYPVLVSFGVNSYPYVIKNTAAGYLSGLSNDGGPLRIISGKTSYNHANGSKQAKLLDKIIVGNDNFYSTHKYNPNYAGAYQEIASTSALNVKVISGSTAAGTLLKDKTYKVGELEELIYGNILTSAQLNDAKVKDFYEVNKNGSFYSDLYEGIDIAYFLENIVQLPGYKGTITFSDGTNKLEMSLEEVLAFSGYNGTTGIGELSPVLAYAKNGTPMVAGKTAIGYESSVTLAAITAYANSITVKNDGGPLAVLFPRTTAGAVTVKTLGAVTSITINLSPDNYAHTELPYSGLASNKITFSGEGTRLTTDTAFTVADIEGLQTLAETGDYNIKNSAESQAQLRYRGIPLYDFLSSTDVGLKPNADKVIVTCADSTQYTFDLADVYKSDYINGQNSAINDLKMLLAYGSAPITNSDIEDGKPLVQVTTAEYGYLDAYGNSGGPISLVVGQTSSTDNNSSKILKDVTSIEVTASEMVSWNHNSSAIYQQYLNSTFQLKVVDANDATILDKTYTLAELESMTSLVERENITWVGTQEWEGINLWDFVLQEAVTVAGITDPTSVTAYASDGFSKELRSIFGMDALQNGIIDGASHIPIIVGYALEGYPLVPTNTSSGYTSSVDNSYGPLRLMTNGNQGACLKNTVKVVVKVGASETEPLPFTEKDFNIYGLESGTVAMDIRTIKNITQGQGGRLVKTYNWFGDHDGNSATGKQATSDTVKGAYLADILLAAGISGSAVSINIKTTDGYAPVHYNNVTMGAIEALGYFVAYDKSTDGGITWTGFSDADKSSPAAISTTRIYRNYDDGTTTWYNRVTNIKGITVSLPDKFNTYTADGVAGNLPLAGIRSIYMDSTKGLWLGTYGGGAAYKAANTDTFRLFNNLSDPALATSYVSAVNVDKNGGVWMTQNASYSNPAGNKGIAYITNGAITYFDETDSPKTIPNNYVQEIQIDENGNIWFGSFGGLTKYNPTAKTWRTWDKTDGLPAMSVDNLIFDNQGGLWLGFYPTGAGTVTDPFVGGFAHMDKNGVITSYPMTADYNSTLKSSLLSQVWIRDIAVDKNGGAWVVASGSYSDLDNVGGNVWHVNSSGVAIEYTGDQLLGNGSLTGNSEIRMVTVDPDGGLWFGTTSDGVFYIADSSKPSVTTPFSITSHYSGITSSWADTSGWNNIYSLDFIGNTLYVGSSAGIAYRTFEFENPDNGGGSATQYDLTINGIGVSETKQLTVNELKNLAGLNILTKTYNSLNSFGTEKSFTFEGVYLENLIKDVIGLKSIAKSITITASDGYSRSFNLDSNNLGIYWSDMQGNKIMLAWKEDGISCQLKLVVGQTDANHVNKPMWISDVETITVNSSTTNSGSGTSGNYEGQNKPVDTASGSAVSRTITSVINAIVKLNGKVAIAGLSLEGANKALAEIQNTVDEDGTIVKGLIEINALSGASGTIAESTQISLPAEVIKAIESAGNVSVKIITDLGEIILTPEILQELIGDSAAIIIKITAAENIKEIVGGRPIVDITITKVGKEISSFGESPIRAGIAYEAESNENQNNLVVYYINENGEMVPVKISSYSNEKNSMLFETSHLSLYGVGYKSVTFKDIQKHWAKNDIEFLASRAIIAGKAANIFDPNGEITRAEYVAMLAKTIDNLEVTGISNTGFDDVMKGAWYFDYINWAVANNIVSGYGNGKFGPTEKITREQISVITENFINAMQKNIDIVNEKTEFKDQMNISPWSLDATVKMQQFNIISGKTDGTFAPQSTATRAEAVTIIKRYIEAILK